MVSLIVFITLCVLDYHRRPPEHLKSVVEPPPTPAGV